MSIRRGTGERVLGLPVSGRPVWIILRRGLRLKLWIIKGRSSADHVRWGMSRISRTGMIRMAWEGMRGRGGEGDGEGLEGKGQGEFLEWEEEVDELKVEAMLGWRSSMMGSSEEMAMSDDMMDGK